jgi:RNA polymerase sigma-70 factor (ECF subfamily)
MSHESPSDEQLLQAFASGQAPAFELLYARHQAGLYRFLRRLLGQRAAGLSDELFQDVWLRVLQGADDWRPQGASFRTWLFTVAHHRVVDELRKSGREIALETESEAFEPMGTAWAQWPPPQTEDLAFWRAAGRRLIDCLDGLPLAQKSVFLLHHEDGVSLDDMARGLGVGFETVKTRLRYAMSKLRLCMGAYLPAPGSQA